MARALGARGPNANISVSLSVDVTVSNGTSPRLLLWDVERYKVGIGHSTSSNQSKFDILQTGKYAISGILAGTCTAGHYQYLDVLVNGVVKYTLNLAPGVAPYSFLSFAGSIDAVAGDYIEFRHVTSDASSQTLYGGDVNSNLMMHLIGS